ncbi:MAG: bifunctional [glutamine synthetase] adenylyltransferase/[glutamine synthetase]-adenylyl-L-tyrosine phosphorylase [Bifidobacteriaceae bacterium]|jgi:glutamate-ammonia-ligase adenylyltransferase|nr:bifunctional [glutamine synthetase] adenylyltransferase/[glutamine synthetase]-adenylyl-L-tyrosine phosphorylase [Bifidobacteriaceae bacterium]
MEDTPLRPRLSSLAARLARLGFAGAARAEGLVIELEAVGIDLLDDAGPRPDSAMVTRVGGGERPEGPPLGAASSAGAVERGAPIEAFSAAADPEQALLATVRIAGMAPQAVRQVLTDREGLARYVGVIGASAAIGDDLVRHPDHLAVLAGPGARLHRTPGEVRAELVSAIGGDPGDPAPVARHPGVEAVDALRVAYRRRLIEIAGFDLASPTPESLFDDVSAALADLAAATLEAALAIARAGIAEHPKARLAVIGMGKCGGRELNYSSDVDVIYVAEPAEGVDETEALRIATDLASALARVTAMTTREPIIWQVDPNLRPEGKQGPLVRTLASHRAYLERWAETWEFQALLKARPVAGDAPLGAAYVEMTRPMVWACVERDGFVEAAQAMRRRVESYVPAGEAERQIKLGRGGLRDVEFSVQLLQLVHGRSDPEIHSATTLTALTALAQGGYVGRVHADRLAACYRFLRVLEHRVQLYGLRRTHLIPASQADKRRLARAARLSPGDPATLDKAWRATRREVRALHEELFYRPLLPETARLSADEAVLAPEAAVRRLTALGYRDPAGAMRHIASLTEGVSRRAAIQRQLLPVMLGWFAEGADPDAGLLSFRRLSEKLGSTHWYLRTLRDSAGAANRLARVLATSRYVAEGLMRSPEAAEWFGDDSLLLPRTPEQLAAEVAAIAERRTSGPEGASGIRAVRRRELVRVAASQLIGALEPLAAFRAVTAVTDAVLAGGLAVAEAEALAGRAGGVPAAGAAPTRMALVAMGSLGGREMGLGSDADVLVVHEPLPDVPEDTAQAYAVAVAGLLRSLLGDTGPEPSLVVDFALRPEGRHGPVARSLGAYREYYERWALTWERQALLRARPLAGDQDVLARFFAMADPVRYSARALTPGQLVELRRIKARVEAERLPRGVERHRHLKLGPGGLIDVQWVAQLIQLSHAGADPSLRVTGTMEALAHAAKTGLLDEADQEILAAAWTGAMRLRDANVLWAGRAGDAMDLLPHDRRTLVGVSRILGYEPGEADTMEEDHQRAARRARAVFDRVFYA